MNEEALFDVIANSFYFKGVDGFPISFHFIKFYFNYCFNLRFVCSNLAANSVAYNHILKALFKGFGKW